MKAFHVYGNSTETGRKNQLEFHMEEIGQSGCGVTKNMALLLIPLKRWDVHAKQH